MKLTVALALGVAVAIGPTSEGLYAQTEKEALRAMSEAHRSWLEQDARYIITDRERDVFLALTTLEERDRFTEAFWRKRDPNRATPQNEYRDEHYRRLEYANKFLGREGFRAGWQTDQGKYYIILGKPQQNQRFIGYNQLVDTEVWFYQGNQSRGLPGFFYLLFFKRSGIGEYELYHPTLDGPEELLRGPEYPPGTEALALIEALDEISPDLAHAALSFDTGDPPDLLTARPSIGVDAVVNRIEESPKRAVRTDYIDGWQRYGSSVSAEYSFNFIPSRSVFSYMVGPEALPLVHFSIEIDPENFGFESDEAKTKFYTTLDITMEARDAEGNLVLAVERSPFIQLSPAQVSQVERAPFAYQDDFPLIPGDYTITVILRNRALSQFTVAERHVEIPQFVDGKPALSDVILCHETKPASGSAADDEIRTFQLGSMQLEPASDNTFAIGDTIEVFTQAYSAAPDYRVHTELTGEAEVFESVESAVGSGSGSGVVSRLDTTGMVGGSYQLRVKLMTPSGELLSERRVPVVLSPRTAIARAGFVYRRGFNTQLPGLLPLARGDQLWNSGRFEEARRDFEVAAAAKNPNLPQVLWKLAGAYLKEARAADALRLLKPLEASFPTQYEVIAGLGFAHYLLATDTEAVMYLEQAMTIRPPDTNLLNALAESHQRLGAQDKAKAYWERSLELNPEQPAVRRRLEE